MGNGNYDKKVTHYSAGAFTTGICANYRRIIAIRSANDPGGPTYYQFATKDNATDGGPALVASGPKDSAINPNYYLDGKKSNSRSVVPLNFKNSVALDGS